MSQVAFPCPRCDAEIYGFTLSVGDGLLHFRFVCKPCKLVSLAALTPEDMRELASGRTVCLSESKPETPPQYLM